MAPINSRRNRISINILSCLEMWLKCLQMLLAGRWPVPWGFREIAELKSSQTRPRVARKIGFCFHKFSLSHLSAVPLKVSLPPPPAASIPGAPWRGTKWILNMASSPCLPACGGVHRMTDGERATLKLPLRGGFWHRFSVCLCLRFLEV